MFPVRIFLQVSVIAIGQIRARHRHGIIEALKVGEISIIGQRMSGVALRDAKEISRRIRQVLEEIVTFSDVVGCCGNSLILGVCVDVLENRTILEVLLEKDHPDNQEHKENDDRIHSVTLYEDIDGRCRLIKFNWLRDMLSPIYQT